MRRSTFVAHVTWHLLALDHVAWPLAHTIRTTTPVEHRTVRGRSTCKSACSAICRRSESVGDAADGVRSHSRELCHQRRQGRGHQRQCHQRQGRSQGRLVDGRRCWGCSGATEGIKTSRNVAHRPTRGPYIHRAPITLMWATRKSVHDSRSTCYSNVLCGHGCLTSGMSTATIAPRNVTQTCINEVASKNTMSWSPATTNSKRPCH